MHVEIKEMFQNSFSQIALGLHLTELKAAIASAEFVYIKKYDDIYLKQQGVFAWGGACNIKNRIKSDT